MAYETIIGLEIHVELATESKIFCSCSTKFGALPNENTCPVCLGLPGTLPVLNETVIEYAVVAGKSLNCEIGLINKTDRKNYFYPDLPKAYQISQSDMPICIGGSVEIESNGLKRDIALTRIHIEEDAGKLIHLEDEDITLVDYNRTGVPLIEIVSEPDLRSPEEALLFLKHVKSILEYAQVSDCKMEEGSLRCDANISIREVGSTELNTRVEIKNLNSFKEVQKALLKEEKRQLELYRFGEGHKIRQETRKWDAAKGRTIPMRSKENAHDYRFFPDPDLPTIYIKDTFVQAIKKALPELPQEKKLRFESLYKLDSKSIDILVSEKYIADYFESLLSFSIEPKLAANWVLTEVLRSLKTITTHGEIPISASTLSQLIALVSSKVISHTAAKEVYKELLTSDKTPLELVELLGLKREDDSEKLLQLVDKIISEQPQAVEDYKNGKGKSIGFLMGQAMKQSGGRADPTVLKDMIQSSLKRL